MIVAAGISDVVLSGSLAAALPVALLAGVVSFASPCILPLVPGYIGYVTATSEPGKTGRGRAVAGVGLFILGFSVAFVAVGAGLGALGSWLWSYQDVLARIMGAVVILLGLVFLGFVPGFQRVIRPSWRPRAGLAGAPLLGLVFGIGWTPCTGPVLAAIGTLSLTSGQVVEGAVLSFVFCLGLGIPFLLLAAGFAWAARGVSWVRRHLRGINIAGGVLLLLLGVLLVSGVWTQWILAVQGVIAGYVSPL